MANVLLKSLAKALLLAAALYISVFVLLPITLLALIITIMAGLYGLFKLSKAERRALIDGARKTKDLLKSDISLVVVRRTPSKTSQDNHRGSDPKGKPRHLSIVRDPL